MPIVVSLSTGEIISKPQYSQADYDRAWEAVAKSFAKRHPDLLRPDSASNPKGGKPNES